MITARNYAAQLEYSLLRRNDSRYTKEASLINNAVHIAIPDNGRIFDDGLRGLIGTGLRLPYPAITVECFFVCPQNIMYRAFDTGEIFKATSHKRLILAAEDEEEEKICYSAFVHIKELNEWVPSGIIHRVPFYTDNIDMMDYGFSDEKAYDKMSSTLEIDPKTIENSIVLCRPMFELLEALSCRNVTIDPLEPVNPATNAKRIKSGKLPIYETHILTIKTNETKRALGSSGGSHASPRQHLRRGHIRRLDSGNIWVNSCVVGDPSRGTIDKQYMVI